MAGEVVAPNLAGHAAEGRGGEHVDLPDVGIGRFCLVVGDDAVDEPVVGLLDGARRDLQDRHVAVAVGAGHAVAVAVIVVGADGGLVDVGGTHMLVLVLGQREGAVPSLFETHGWFLSFVTLYRFGSERFAASVRSAAFRQGPAASAIPVG